MLYYLRSKAVPKTSAVYYYMFVTLLLLNELPSGSNDENETNVMPSHLSDGRPIGL